LFTWLLAGLLAWLLAGLLTGLFTGRTARAAGWRFCWRFGGGNTGRTSRSSHVHASSGLGPCISPVSSCFGLVGSHLTPKGVWVALAFVNPVVLTNTGPCSV
jgi:hypothetical protein